MYSRSYIGNDAPVTVPEGYDGIAMKDSPTNVSDGYQETKSTGVSEKAPQLNPWEADRPTKPEEKEESVGAFSAPGSSLGTLLSGLKLPIVGALKLPRIGTEEILILAAAAYLLFSKGGDKECALMLIILLFVT